MHHYGKNIYIIILTLKNDRDVRSRIIIDRVRSVRLNGGLEFSNCHCTWLYLAMFEFYRIYNLVLNVCTRMCSRIYIY